MAAVVMLRDPQTGAVASLLAGVVMGWIGGEILLLEQPVEPTGTEVFYFALGLVMVGLGLLVKCAETMLVGQ